MRSFWLLLAAVALVSASFALETIADDTENGSVAVVGLSAGAFMANQLHVAFSSLFDGMGSIAGGPFYCALANIDVALSACMGHPELIDVQVLLNAAKYCIATGALISCGKLTPKQRVYLFSGTKDSSVTPGVVKAQENFYSQIMLDGAIKTDFSVPAEHSWPTQHWGSRCDFNGSPYINNCSRDISFEMLQHLFHDTLKPPLPLPSPPAYVELEQGDHTPLKVSPSVLSLGKKAFLFVPTTVRAQPTGQPLKVVVALHGCKQTEADVGSALRDHVGLNEIAEANGMIVLYPQVIRSPVVPYNPLGCFDWWGYTGTAYASKLGPQMATIANMVRHLTSGHVNFAALH